MTRQEHYDKAKEHAHKSNEEMKQVKGSYINALLDGCPYAIAAEKHLVMYNEHKNYELTTLINMGVYR